MKSILSSVAFLALSTFCYAEEKANHLLEFLDVGKQVQAEFIQVEEDPSGAEFKMVLAESQKKDPAWFTEHLKDGKPGTPIAYHEKLMTKEQYEGYLQAWKKRKIVALKDKAGKNVRIAVLLTKESNGKYVINIPDVPVSLLEYDPETNAFASMTGDLNFLEKIDAPEDSSLGAWTGYEWLGKKEGAFDSLKQNFAIGRTANGKFGYLIYRTVQSSANQVISQKSFVLRFAPVKKAK